MHIADAYKHLGAYIAANLSMLPELNHRINSLWATIASFRKAFYHNKAFGKDTKAATLHTLLHSRLFYNAAMWMRLNKGNFRKINGAYLKSIHMVAETKIGEYTDPLVNQRALASTGQTPLDVHLRFLRLRFLPRLLRLAPDILLTILDVAPTWKAMIIEDLAWMAANSSKLNSMPDPAQHLAEWLAMASQHPAQWIGLCKLVRAKFVPAPCTALPPPEPAPELPKPLCCYECGYACTSWASLRMHARMSHGMRSPLLAAIHDTSCLSCLKQYHCTDRLLQHLQAVPACFHRVSQNVEAMDTEALQVMRGLERDILRAARRTGKGRPLQLRLPCVRLHGPLTSWASDEPS